MSTLDPAGPAAGRIADIWWVMFWGSIAILLAVTALAMYAACRRSDRRRSVSSGLLIIGGGLVFPTVVLAALLVYGLREGHSLLPLPTDEPVFRVEVTAHQWWWEVAYPDADGQRIYEANELHIPAGRPVDVHLRSADVVHSFWVPRLAGKLDAIPGLTNVIRLRAEEPGIYRGQCAEFCGKQHARMALRVEAHEELLLQRRLAALAGASPDGRMRADADAFEAECARCHSVQASTKSDEVGPNLAGLAMRDTLGAGTVPNGEGALHRWLVEHQVLKPGNLMPGYDRLDPDRLGSIVRYLETVR